MTLFLISKLKYAYKTNKNIPPPPKKKKKKNWIFLIGGVSVNQLGVGKSNFSIVFPEMEKKQEKKACQFY